MQAFRSFDASSVSTTASNNWKKSHISKHIHLVIGNGNESWPE
jgi:hypothetical protein